MSIQSCTKANIIDSGLMFPNDIKATVESSYIEFEFSYQWFKFISFHNNIVTYEFPDYFKHLGFTEILHVYKHEIATSFQLDLRDDMINTVKESYSDDFTITTIVEDENAIYRLVRALYPLLNTFRETNLPYLYEIALIRNKININPAIALKTWMRVFSNDCLKFNIIPREDKQQLFKIMNTAHVICTAASQFYKP